MSRRVLLFLAIGVGVRVLPVARSPYPLGAGGLFYWVTQYIARHHALPSTIPYYSCGVPYAYPPFGFLLYAFVHEFTRAPLLPLMQWGAVVFSSLALLAFWGLARELLIGEAVDFAVLAFATLPSVAWRLTVSDGVRNVAFFLYLCGLWAFYRTIYARRGYRAALLTGLFLGLTLMTHLSVSASMVMALLVFTVWACRARGDIAPARLLALSVAAALVLSLPWFGYLYRHYGPDLIPLMWRAFRSRPHKSIWLLTILRFGNTDEPYATLWGVLGYMGLAYSTLFHGILLPLWYVVLPIHWFKPAYAVPLALGAGLGAQWFLSQALKSQDKVRKVVLAFLVTYTTLVGLTYAVTDTDPTYVRNLAGYKPRYQVTPPRQEAWAWMREHIPGARVVVVGEDKEWVPAMAHVCVNVSQGAEWVGLFLSQGEMYNHIVAVSGFRPLFDVLKRYRQDVEYVYISDLPIRKTLVADFEHYSCAREIFRNQDVALFDVRACAKY